MVYYSQKLHPAQLPPPVCPKCGSHRTQVVGRSEDAKSVVVRCSACGERSTVVVNEGEEKTASDEISLETLELSTR